MSYGCEVSIALMMQYEHVLSVPVVQYTVVQYTIACSSMQCIAVMQLVQLISSAQHSSPAQCILHVYTVLHCILLQYTVLLNTLYY